MANMIVNPLKHARQHQQIISLLYKYSRSDLVRNSGLLESVSGDQRNVGNETEPHSTDDSSAYAGPEDLANDLEAMGPAYMKLGQLLSTRADFVPADYRLALTRLQDDTEPIPAKDIFRIIEEELGKQPEYLFRSFDIEPMATASLGQVHRATMNNGREVVVKVQRPGVVKQLESDIEAMEEVASLCETFQFGKDYQLSHMVESLKQSLAQEVDYLREAANADMVAHNLTRFENITIPLPVKELTTQRVITMEYVDSTKITDVDTNRLSTLKRKDLAREFFEAFLHQVLVHGAFHADPHPGNVGITKQNRIVLMDYGLVVKVSKRLQSQLIKLLLAICDGDGSKAASIAESCGTTVENFETAKFRASIERIVAENVNRNVQQLDAGTALMEIQQSAGKHGLVLPQEVILLGRALMHLEKVVSVLDSEFDPNEAIREHAMQIMREHSGKELTFASVYQTFLESTEFAQKLPERANKLAELVTNNEFEFKVNAFDESKLLAGLHKVANRISAGLVIAAMIVGASLMMRLETSWTIAGYPAIAFVFFMLAAIAGSMLVWRAVISDHFDG
jgi:predicted unusual protein kinase regulating ubiquinone biosynthesis (AarF/ABC1/UbiB family)